MPVILPSPGLLAGSAPEQNAVACEWSGDSNGAVAKKFWSVDEMERINTLPMPINPVRSHATASRCVHGFSIPKFIFVRSPLLVNLNYYIKPSARLKSAGHSL
jgi:hypothetical protein